MNACPKASIPDFKDKLQEENLYLITEVVGLSLNNQISQIIIA